MTNGELGSEHVQGVVLCFSEDEGNPSHGCPLDEEGKQFELRAAPRSETVI
jgi:hypothetical protein